MNKVQRMLHSGANDEIISLLASMEKLDDFGWLASHGFYERKPWGGGLTGKGKAFIQKQNRITENLFQKNQKYLESEKFHNLRKLLLEHQKGLTEGNVLDGLTEDEAFAVRYLLKTY